MLGVVRRLAALVVAVLVVSLSSAHAWRVERAQSIAEVVWHNPCNGTARLVQSVDIDGYAEADIDRCVVYVLRGAPWLDFCTAVLHEYGHLAGFRDPTNWDPMHSGNPRSVMFVMPRSDARCYERGRRFLERAGRRA